MRKVSEVTTEQIREATSKGFVASLGYKSISDTQFDLWLATDRNRIAELAMAKERERIIKLLKAEFGAWSEAVALIEGENK